MWSQEVWYRCREKGSARVSARMCVWAGGCMSVCNSMTAFREALLGQLILSHLRSWVRIIKPISSLWLLQPACDWITTQPQPSAPRRERMREEKDETRGKKEMRKEINKESRQREASGEWKRNREDEIEREHEIKIVSISHQPSLFGSYLLPPAHTTDIYSMCYLSCGPFSISLLLSSAKKWSIIPK